MDKQIKKLLKVIERYVEIPNGDIEQIEGLHKVRVTARKLVSVSPPESYSGKLFKKVIQSSNHLRDLDVFRSEVLKDFPEAWQESMQALYQGIEELRDELDAKFKLLLDMELREELEVLSANYDQIAKKSTSDSHRHKLELIEIEKRLRKQLKILQKLDLEDKQVHKVRLKIKRLRYQLEHFYAKEERLLTVTTYLQNELGHFHDITQGIKLLKQHKELMSEEQLTRYLEHMEQTKNTLLQNVRKKLHSKYRKI